MKMRRGLVVGKLAPLHRGHELVIRRALSECDEVLVLSWANPEPPGCAADSRRRWIADLFPQVRALVVTDALLREQSRGELTGWTVPPDDAEDAVQRRFAGLLCRDLLGVTVDAVYGSEDYLEGFAAALTALFAEGRARSRGGTADAARRVAVEHVSVDPHRRAVPISGSAIRRDVHAHREWLSPQVYASFVERVAILGGESSGKTTLATGVARRLGTVWVPEYGRIRWQQVGGRLTLADLETIADRQVFDEDRAALRARRFLVCDTSPLTTLFYSLEMHGRASARLHTLAERQYDHVVLCAPEFAFVQDGTRRDSGFRRRQHTWYEAELRRRGCQWLDARGSAAHRVERLAAALEAVLPPSS